MASNAVDSLLNSVSGAFNFASEFDEDDVPQVVKVHIVQARGLRDADVAAGAGLSDPYCTAEVVGKPWTRITSQVLDNTANPVWNYEGTIGDMEPGEVIKFTIYDQDYGKQDDMLGEALLKWSDFVGVQQGPTFGFKGQLPLTEAGEVSAHLTVHVFRGDMKSTVTSFKSREDRRQQRNKQKAVVTRRQFRDFLLVERARAESCSTLPFTILVWLSFAFVAWMHGDVQSMYRLRACVTDAITEVNADYLLPFSAVTKHVSLDAVSSVPEMYAWIGRGLVPALHGYGERPGFVRGFNKVVGKARLRQKRAKIDACNLEEGLRQYFEDGCRVDEVSMKMYGPPSTNFTRIVTDEFMNPIEETVVVYDPSFVPGGLMPIPDDNLDRQRFYVWLDPLHPDWGTARVAQLADLGWCDDATKEVDVNVVLYNPEINSFVQVNIHFDVKASGLVRHVLDVRPLSAHVYPNTGRLLTDVIWMLLLTAGFFIVLQDWSDRKGKPWAWWLWLYVDLFAVILGMALVVFFVVFGLGLGSVGDSLALLAGVGSPTPPLINATAADRHGFAPSAAAHEWATMQIMDQLSSLVTIRIYHRLSMFWYTVLILARFFRGFMGQPKMAAIGRTIAAASSDLVHLGIILFVVFENFALGGVVLFGLELREWASFINAQRATLAVLFGRGDYAAMHTIAPISAIVWLVAFVLTMIFILSNMLIAIFVDHFRDSRPASGQAEQNILEQFYTLVGDFVWKGGYETRVLVRMLKTRLPAKPASWLPNVGYEQKRIKRIPWDDLLASMEPPKVKGEPQQAGRRLSVAMAGIPVGGEHKRSIPMWAPITREQLVDAGLDTTTAARLLGKAYYITHQRVPNDFPADVLYYDFEQDMKRSYAKLEECGDDLQSWLAERLVDCCNLEPRQKKLMELSAAMNNKDGVAPLALTGVPMAEGNAPGMPLLGTEGNEGHDNGAGR